MAKAVATAGADRRAFTRRLLAGAVGLAFTGAWLRPEAVAGSRQFRDPKSCIERRRFICRSAGEACRGTRDCCRGGCEETAGVMHCGTCANLGARCRCSRDCCSPICVGRRGERLCANVQRTSAPPLQLSGSTASPGALRRAPSEASTARLGCAPSRRSWSVRSTPRSFPLPSAPATVIEISLGTRNGNGWNRSRERSLFLGSAHHHRCLPRVARLQSSVLPRVQRRDRASLPCRHSELVEESVAQDWTSWFPRRTGQGKLERPRRAAPETNNPLPKTQLTPTRTDPRTIVPPPSTKWPCDRRHHRARDTVTICLSRRP